MCHDHNTGKHRLERTEKLIGFLLEMYETIGLSYINHFKTEKKNSEDVYINTCRCVHIKLQQGGSVLVLHLGTREIVALSATEAG